MRELQTAAATLRLKLHVLHTSSEQNFAAAFASLAQLRTDTLVVEVIIAVERRRRWPRAQKERIVGGYDRFGLMVVDCRPLRAMRVRPWSLAAIPLRGV